MAHLNPLPTMGTTALSSQPEPENPVAQQSDTRGVKRPATLDSPQRKRPKTEESPDEIDGSSKPKDLARKPSAKVSTKAILKSTASFVQTKPYYNPLPVAPEVVRPAPRLFFWGSGEFGQFGVGEEKRLTEAEVLEPDRNEWVIQGMSQGRFGQNEGAGLTSVAAGGLHSLFLDENGTVCETLFIRH